MEVVIFLIVLLISFLVLRWVIKGNWKAFRQIDEELENYQPPQPYDLYGLPNPDEVNSIVYDNLEEEVMASKSEKRVTYHVVPHTDGWAIKRNRQVVETHPRKAEAVQAGRKLAKSHSKGQLVVHKKDGKIQTEYTYGADPRKSRG